MVSNSHERVTPNRARTQQAMSQDSTPHLGLIG